MALIDTLGEIPDPRRGNAQRHALLDILAVALVASVCGAESCVEFAEDRETLLREFLSLKIGLPASAGDPDGPTLSPEPSSAKCDSPGPASRPA
jgi:hypothetical protein